MSDKIREEFEISKLFNSWMTESNTEDEIIFEYLEGDDNAVPFYGGYKSRDNEVLELTSRVAVAEGEVEELKAENLGFFDGMKKAEAEMIKRQIIINKLKAENKKSEDSIIEINRILIKWQQKNKELAAENKGLYTENRDLKDEDKTKSVLMKSWGKEVDTWRAENKKLREIIECKNILLVAYRLGTNRGVGKALDRLQALKEVSDVNRD